MGRTLAIHWAATTHGTWLHGDARNSWRNGRLIGPDPFLEESIRESMTDDAVVLDAAERTLLAKTFGEVVREQRHRVFAATVQATHVHLVFAPTRENIKTVITRFKYRSASAILRHRREVWSQSSPADTAGLYSRAVPARGENRRPIRVPRSLWTARQFPVFIFDEFHLTNAVEYVRDHNRRLGLPADPFDWIDPLFPAREIVGERVVRSRICEKPLW